MKTISPSVKLVIAILICELTGFLSGRIGSAANNEWFDQLDKPSWYPPGSIFGPVWIALYLLMGISVWLIWKSEDDRVLRLTAMIVFSFQLLLNFLWSIIFFRLQSPGLAFADITGLIFAVITTMILFSRISRLAAWLLLPYLLWLCFAATLNYSIWTLN